MHPEPRRRSRHSRGEKYVLAGGEYGSRSKHDFSLFRLLRFHGTCEACPAGRVRWAEGDWIPCRETPTPKAFPLGGRWAGEAGSDEGATLYPTFPCRKEVDGSRPDGLLLLPRWATRSPPHPSPSVTASPQGEASGLCYPTRKKRPKSGYADGHRNSPPTGTLRPTTPKPASGNERAIKKGGPGGKAPGAFSSGFLRRKPGSRPESGGNPRRRWTCDLAPTEPPADHRPPPSPGEFPRPQAGEKCNHVLTGFAGQNILLSRQCARRARAAAAIP